MPISGYVDKVFTETGFSNWQKALQKFDKHQQSQSHKFAASMVMRERRKARGVNEILSSAHAQEMEHNRKNFLLFYLLYVFLQDKVYQYMVTIILMMPFMAVVSLMGTLCNCYTFVRKTYWS